MEKISGIGGFFFRSKDSSPLGKWYEIAGDIDFIEVFVDTPLEVCEARDPKGMYARARRGEIPNFTGISSPYEPPEKADIHLDAGERPAEELADEVLQKLQLDLN